MVLSMVFFFLFFVDHWKPPPLSFAKVNVDEAWTLRGAACGGIVQDHHGVE